MDQGAWTLLVALVLATAFGLYRAARDGRFRGTHEVKGGRRTSTHGAGRDEPSTGHSGAGAPATGESVTGESATGEPSVLDGTGIVHELGSRATLLQFSSAFCAPCRATRRVLAEVTEIVPGITHVEIDAEHHLELVRRLGITRTPTTLVLDEHGREATRAAGAPQKQEVLATLAKVVGTP